jgi:hypothetical protein
MHAYYFHQGLIIRTLEGRTDGQWKISDIPTEELRSALSWNDGNGDFEGLERVTLLEIFIDSFIRH